jgi:hypothetical protein
VSPGSATEEALFGVRNGPSVLLAFGAVVGGERFATRVRGFVYGRISFDLPVVDEAVSA